MSQSKLERDYQASLIERLRDLFPGIEILKNDSGYQQGIPDLSLFYWGNWAWLEVKAFEGAEEQPNQRHFIEKAQMFSFAAFIYPENEQEVLDALEQAWRPERDSCLPWR